MNNLCFFEQKIFFSQYKQDEYVYNNYFKDKKDGFFLEIGADDGIRFSNCAFFEKTLGWNGIAIERHKHIRDRHSYLIATPITNDNLLRHGALQKYSKRCDIDG